MAQKTQISYEVYEKRALYEPYQSLPLLDRTPIKRRAVESANAWGGLVLKQRLEEGKVVASEVVHIHKVKEQDELDVVTLRDLLKRLYEGQRRPKSHSTRHF